MHLDFAQVLTQIFAFLIVFWFLRKYGWNPLLNAMEERKQTIKSQFDAIQEQKEEVQQLKDNYQLKLSDIESKARLQIQEAIAEGRKIAQEIQAEAKKQAKSIIQKAEEETERHIAEVKNHLKDEIVMLAFAATKKILEEEMSDARQKKMISEFVEHMEFKK